MPQPKQPRPGNQGSGRCSRRHRPGVQPGAGVDAQQSRREDGEAPLRLFYAAVARARRSLATATSGAHSFADADCDSEMLRKLDTPPGCDPPEPERYQVPELTSADRSCAGDCLGLAPAILPSPRRRGTIQCLWICAREGGCSSMPMVKCWAEWPRSGATQQIRPRVRQGRRHLLLAQIRQ